MQTSWLLLGRGNEGETGGKEKGGKGKGNGKRKEKGVKREERRRG